MAIAYLNKLFESTTNSDPTTVVLTNAVPADSLILMAITAKRSGASPSIVSITDSQGNTWDWTRLSTSTSMVAVAWCRTPVAMSTSDTVTVDFNGALTDKWVSGHAFDNASGTPTDEQVDAASSSLTPQLTLAVTGSDWLTFAAFYLINVSGGYTFTPVNSSLSRDTTTLDQAECFSRNGTTGTTHTIGATLAYYATWLGAGVSFPFEGTSTSGNIRGQKTLVGI